jgi:uncharacterized membrane protein
MPGQQDFALRLVAAIVVVIAVMTALACVRWSIWSYGSDTGTFAQSIAHAFGGFTNSVEPGGTHFRTHWSPILAVLWPAVALTHSPLSIQLAQIVLVALSAVPLYAIVARHADEAWGLRCAILALIYPPLLANAFSEFHELAFYPVVTLALVWAADSRRWSWFALFALAGATIREDACATLVVFGIVLAIAGARHNRSYVIAGSSLAVLCGGALLLYVFTILPRYGSWMPSHFYSYVFAPGGMALNTGSIGGRLTYLLEAFAPLAFLPLFSRWTLLAVPAFAGILFANNPGVWRMGEHYILLAVPWLLLGATDTLLRLRAVRWWRAAAALCAVFLIALNPMHPVHYLRAEPYQHSADAERAMACVPRSALVATHDEWLSHFALAYPGVTQFRRARRDRNFDGYFVFASDWENPEFLHSVIRQIRSAETSGRYRIACKYGTVVVLAPNGPHHRDNVSRINRKPVKPASHNAASPI